MGRVQGRRAIVTAATDGIGLAIARRLCLEGAHVLISSRKPANVERAVAEIEAAVGTGPEVGTVEGMVCHVGKQAHREVSGQTQADTPALDWSHHWWTGSWTHKHTSQALVARAVAKWGPGASVDIFISNAAVNPAAGSILEMSETAVAKILDINVGAAVALTQLVAPHLADHGAVLYVSSVTAYQPRVPLGMYAVSKTALLGLTKAVAQELAPRGIRCNSLCPGIVPTKFAGALVADEALVRQQEETTMLGRLGTAEEMANAALFLVSSDAGYVTAENLVVAGGMASKL